MVTAGSTLFGSQVSGNHNQSGVITHIGVDVDAKDDIGRRVNGLFDDISRVSNLD
jgi:hypothetical protein